MGCVSFRDKSLNMENLNRIQSVLKNYLTANQSEGEKLILDNVYAALVKMYMSHSEKFDQGEVNQSL